MDVSDDITVPRASRLKDTRIDINVEWSGWPFLGAFFSSVQQGYLSLSSET